MNIQASAVWSEEVEATQPNAVQTEQDDCSGHFGFWPLQESQGKKERTKRKKEKRKKGRKIKKKDLPARSPIGRHEATETIQRPGCRINCNGEMGDWPIRVYRTMKRISCFKKWRWK